MYTKPLSATTEFVQVKFENATDYFFGHSFGMMGSFENGQMVGRDATTIISDPNEFGQEWQVLPSEPKLFQDRKRAPQAPMKCIMPTQTDIHRRRLGGSLARSAAESACSHWRAEQQNACVFDVLMTGDLDLAAAGSF